MSEGANGRVFFVGAGPGDPALITRRGFEVIAAADLVLYDRLAARCMPEFSGSATWECVEQLPGCHPDRVVSIVERMLAAARSGQTVVRLKGGDAMVFGRSAEEWEPLLEAGIPFQVIPGVTSSLAAAAASLVTLTDRRSASAVAFITGHENPDKSGSMLDWGLLARFPGTLVFYMGVARLGHVVDQLIRHGKPAETPVAVVANASFAHEKRLEATLGTVLGEIGRRGISAPAITIVGEVARGAASRAPMANRALSGRVVVTTRPQGQEGPLLAVLAARGATAINIPVLGIGPAPDLTALDGAIDEARGHDWVVFSSANGVRAWFARLGERGLDARVFGHAKVAAIGRETARQLQTHGIRADLVPEAERSEGLEAALIQLARGKRLLLVRADRGRDHLEKALDPIAKVQSVAAYSQIDHVLHGGPEIARFSTGEFDALVATSGRAFQGAIRHAGEAAIRRLQNGEAKIIALGGVTAGAVAGAGFPVAQVAQTANPQSIADAVEVAFGLK